MANIGGNFFSFLVSVATLFVGSTAFTPPPTPPPRSPAKWVHLVGGGQLICREGPIFFRMRKSRRTVESRGASTLTGGRPPWALDALVASRRSPSGLPPPPPILLSIKFVPYYIILSYVGLYFSYIFELTLWISLCGGV